MPAKMRAAPAIILGVTGSFNIMKERISVITMLALSMAAT